LGRRLFLVSFKEEERGQFAEGVHRGLRIQGPGNLNTTGATVSLGRLGRLPAPGRLSCIDHHASSGIWTRISAASVREYITK
jgi:hypothetical protein